MIGNKDNRRLLLQPRDLHLLKEAAILKVFDRIQAQICAGFHSAPRANTRLPKLVSAGLLGRFFIATESGGRKSIYTPTKKGAAVAEVSFSGIKRSKDKLLFGDLFVAHQLHINDIYLKVKYKIPPEAGVRFKRWIVPKAPLSAATPIIPDAFFQIEDSVRTVSSFLECDMGGESGKVWLQKIEAYIAFATTGEFQRQFGERQFRVLIATTTYRRIRFIRSLITKYTDKIFWLSTFELINRNGFWSSVWLRPNGDQAQAFIARSL
jgi:hypothetical protein